MTIIKITLMRIKKTAYSPLNATRIKQKTFPLKSKKNSRQGLKNREEEIHKKEELVQNEL
jgi:hypothetical protein